MDARPNRSSTPDDHSVASISGKRGSSRRRRDERRRGPASGAGPAAAAAAPVAAALPRRPVVIDLVADDPPDVIDLTAMTVTTPVLRMRRGLRRVGATLVIASYRLFARPAPTVPGET